MPITNSRKEQEKNFIIYGKMKSLRITENDLAERLGIHRNTVGRKLNDMSFGLGELRIIINTLRLDDEEILRLIKK